MPASPRLLLAVLLLAAAPFRSALAAAADRGFDRIGDDFLRGWLERHPQLATGLGTHEHDRKLIPVTEATVAEEVAWLGTIRARLDSLRPAELSFDHRLERDALAARIERERLELELIRPFEHDPGFYLDLVLGSVQMLLERRFASPCERADAAAARLSRVPEVLRAASINLRNPPRISTEIAIARFAAVPSFYRETVPQLTAGCREPRHQANLAEADSAAVEAIEAFLKFLREDLLPRSNGELGLGREVYERWLATETMDTTSVDTLLARAWVALDEHHARMEALAPEIAPGFSLRAALDTVAQTAPAGDSLVEAMRIQLDRVRDFLRHHDLITLPPDEDIRVRETPLSRRTLSLAALDAPGVWERQAAETYLNVTPFDPAWDEDRGAEHRALFNRWSSRFTVIHEALPGRGGRWLALRRAPSRLRQALGSESSAEGWAHYCEQMMVEQGFGADPRYRLAQLALAVRGIGRLIAGVSLYRGAMTFDEAVRLLEQRCFMAPATAERELRRGIADPGWFVHTLEKWRILELREQAQRLLGPRFRLLDFHDAVLRNAIAPLPIVRAAILQELEEGSGRTGRRAPPAGGAQRSGTRSVASEGSRADR